MANRMLTTRRFQSLEAASINNLTVNELAVAPGPGAVSVWAASTQDDGLLTVRIGGHLQANRQLITNRGANAPISTEEESADATGVVRGGERITIDYVEVTAASARFIVAWAGVDLGLS